MNNFLFLYILSNLSTIFYCFSFFSRIKDEQLNNLERIKDGFTIIFSVCLIDSEIKKPPQSNIGTFIYNASKDDPKTDILGHIYDQNLVDQAINEILTKTLNIYQSYYKGKLFDDNEQKIEEKITYVSVNSEESIDFMSKLIKQINNKFPSTSQITISNFDKDKFINDPSFYSSLNNLPKLSLLKDSYSVIDFGFDITKICSKYKNKINKNQNIYEMIPSDENVSSLMEKFFYDEDHIKFYSAASPLVPCYIFSKTEIKSNITILKSITDNYLFDYTSDSTFQNTNKDIYPTIKELSRIISYEYLLSSDIHNYLQLSPFLNLLVELFNNTISKSLNTTKEPDNKRVGVIFGVYDIVIEGIYRLFSYNGYEKEMNNKNICELDNSQCPFIQFGTSIYFDLIKENNSGNYYIIFGEYFPEKDERKNTIGLKLSDFSSLLNDILLFPDFDENFRKSYCN